MLACGCSVGLFCGCNVAELLKLSGREGWKIEEYCLSLGAGTRVSHVCNPYSSVLETCDACTCAVEEACDDIY